MSSVLSLHYNKIRRVLVIVLALNWAVAAAKIIYGLITHCASMTADGFHSLADGTSNIIGLVGIMFCAQPIDKDHPYGHKKYETLFALGIAALLAFVSVNLFKQGIHGLFHPETPSVDLISFIVMIITMGVNVLVMTYEIKQGNKLQSDILTVDAMHTRADLLTSASVIVSLIAIKLGFPVVDPIVTVLIAGFIAYGAFEIIKTESAILCDATAIRDPKQIEKIVLKVDGVKGCHKIRSRGRLDDIHIDLHIQLDPATRMDKAHDISYDIEDAIRKDIPSVSDVLVHLEPMEKRKRNKS
ncbi:MAG: cation diffusion facilitator family transporter [Candidatus Omnitrophota bacterium]|jgi:cation diffusion facilitator family transporter